MSDATSAAQDMAYERGEAYRYVGSAFASPVEESFPGLENLAKYRTFVASVDPDAIESLDRWIRAAADYDRETLLVEYSRLFVGPFHLPAPPYGSVYLEDGARVMGESTLDVAKCYREAGLEIADTFNDVPDHISAELEFMRFLCRQQREATEHGDDASVRGALFRQHNFIKRFLARWVPDFSARVKHSTKNALYAALADNLLWLIRFELMYITNSLAEQP